MIAFNFQPMDGSEDISIQDFVQNKDALVAGTATANSDQIQVWDGSKFEIYPKFVSWAPGRRGFCRVTTTSRPASVQKPVFA